MSSERIPLNLIERKPISFCTRRSNACTSLSSSAEALLTPVSSRQLWRSIPRDSPALIEVRHALT